MRPKKRSGSAKSKERSGTAKRKKTRAVGKARPAKTSKRRSPAPAKQKGGAWDHVFSPRASGERRYWLVKSEPGVFSFDDLLRAYNKTTHWNGVRNFTARNFMRDGMKLGDRVFFYHSMSDEPGIVGICEVVREGYPDSSAFDASSEGYDAKSDPAKPTWYMVDLRAVAQFTHPVTLAQIKARKELEGMALVRIGRLSVTPVSAEEWAVITRLAGG